MRDSLPRRQNLIALISVSFFVGLAVQHAQATGQASAFKQLGDFETCLQQSSPVTQETCLNLLKGYAKKTPKDALAAAKLVRRSFNAGVALQFFEPLVARNAKAVCADEDLSLAVVTGLALPHDYPDARRARKIFAEQCYVDQEAAVIAEVAPENATSFLKENACPILKKHGKAPPSCQPEAEATPLSSAPETLPKLDKSQIKLGQSKAYRGDEGETVTVIPVQGGDLYLVRFDGIQSPWNGKVILHRMEDKGHGAATFWTLNNGARWNSIAQRGGIEVFTPGYKPGSGFVVSYSEKATIAVDSKAVLDAFQP